MTIINKIIYFLKRWCLFQQIMTIAGDDLEVLHKLYFYGCRLPSVRSQDKIYARKGNCVMLQSIVHGLWVWRYLDQNLSLAASWPWLVHEISNSVNGNYNTNLKQELEINYDNHPGYKCFISRSYYYESLYGITQGECIYRQIEQSPKQSSKRK